MMRFIDEPAIGSKFGIDHHRIDEWSSDRHGDAVLARTLVVGIRRAGAVGRHAICDGDEILVIFRVGVTAVANADAIGNDRELEDFVLGAL